PYMASAFGIFLLRQTFKTIPRELEEAARVEGCSWLGVLWRVYVPLARPTYLAYALVSVSYHWNNFLWPLIVANSVETRSRTAGRRSTLATSACSRATISGGVPATAKSPCQPTTS